MKSVDRWKEQYGHLYPQVSTDKQMPQQDQSDSEALRSLRLGVQISMGYTYLKDVMKLQFPELRARAAAREAEAAARQASAVRATPGNPWRALNLLTERQTRAGEDTSHNGGKVRCHQAGVCFCDCRHRGCCGRDGERQRNRNCCWKKTLAAFSCNHCLFRKPRSGYWRVCQILYRLQSRMRNGKMCSLSLIPGAVGVQAL